MADRQLYVGSNRCDPRNRRISIDEPLGKVTFSGGVARGRHADGTSALQRADALLYAAKNGGRNQVHCKAA